jgi:hypothetical protein
MTEARFVARRVAAAIDRDFPDLPTLPPTALVRGLAFVLPLGAPQPDLRVLRDHVRGLWRGPLAADARDREVVVVRFDQAMRIDRDRWPSALPLAAADAFTLRSFAMDGGAIAALPRIASTEDPRWVDLWWDGRRQRVALDALDRLSIVGLWDLPTLHLHRADPIARIAVGPRSARNDPDRAAYGDLAPDLADAGVDGPTGPLGVPTAPLMLADARRDSLSDMTDALDHPPRRGLLDGLRRLFAPRAVGGGRAASGGGRSGQGRPASPGWLAGLAGWLRWHSPLGGAVRQQYSQRVSQVEKLISSGDIDGALRLALRLGAGHAGDALRRRFPNRLPPMRASLDFDLTSASFSMPILSGDSFSSLQWRYLQLASELERAGDFRRAAYIYSQLLGNHQRAVEALAQGEMYAEAARLALDARLEPAVTIAMLFKAGDLDAALALARRTACFDRLAADSDGKEPAFHVYVIKAWTDMLLATGQPLRALQVSDALAAVADADTVMLDVRRRWLVAALRDAGGDGFSPELVARALATARWTGEDLSPLDLAELPHLAAAQGGTPFPPVLDQLQATVRGDLDDAPAMLVDLLTAIRRVAAFDSPEQAAFWAGPAATLLEPFTRALVEIASRALTQDDLQALRTLLARAGLPVLAADLGKLGKVAKVPGAGARHWNLPPAVAVKPPVRRACLLAGRMIVAWRDNDLLELIDRSGAVLWRGTISNVVGLVAVGTSPHVIVIQAQRDGTCLLTRFASHRRTFHPIGAVDLAAWHDITSESQWLVQIDGKIGALDLVGLCAPVPQLTFLWSCSLTDRLHVRAFHHSPDVTRWLTCDVGPDRNGLIELWTLRSNGALSCSLCTPTYTGADPATLAPTNWYWDLSRIVAASGPTRATRIVPWSDAEERVALTFLANRRAAGFGGDDHFQACDFGRPRVGIAQAGEGEGAETEVAIGSGASVVAMRLGHDPDLDLRCLARGWPEVATVDAKAAIAHGVALLADDHGRLFVVDARRARVDQL